MNKLHLLVACAFFIVVLPACSSVEAKPGASNESEDKTKMALSCGPQCNCAAEADYTRTINERADKIVASLKIEDAAKALRARDAIAHQYRDLREIHDSRAAALKKAQENSDKAARASAEAAIKDDAQSRLDVLHAAFLAKLAHDLTPEQIDSVKNGLTYNVLNVTYNAYQKKYPKLTDAQKKQLWDWLVEAREKAMDQGTSEEKHGVFGKYKGRINNYLVKEGYSL